MPLFLGKKRTHSQAYSDDEADNYLTASSSSIPTPNTTHRMRSDDSVDTRKSKLPRYSLPTESPNNLFRIGNDRLFTKQNAEQVLPDGVQTYLELKVQLKHFHVFRVVQVPTSYTFHHLHSLLCFLFGWEGHYAPEWRLVKDITLASEIHSDGEIVASRPWKELRPVRKSNNGIKGRDDNDNPFLENRKKVEDEKEWTVGKVWGAGGIFSQRAAIYNYNLGTPWTVEITMKSAVSMPKASNQPVIIRSRGAPPAEDELSDYNGESRNEEAEHKYFYKEDFNGRSFEQYLKGEYKTFLGRRELVLCSPQEHAEKVREERNLIARELEKAVRTPSVSNSGRGDAAAAKSRDADDAEETDED